MTTVLLVIHLLISLALVGVILLQRSEGGALGIGGGGAGGGGGAFGGLMTGRGLVAEHGISWILHRLVGPVDHDLFHVFTRGRSRLTAKPCRPPKLVASKTPLERRKKDAYG
jgi:protein translocase SecG subunit